MQLKSRKPAAPRGGAPRMGHSPEAARRAQQHWQRGLQLAKVADWPGAESAFVKACAACPGDILYALNLASAQRKQGASERAGKTALGILAIDSANSLAREIAVDCLSKQNRHAEAAALLQDMPEHLPRDTEHYQNLGGLLSNAGKHSEAIVALFEALKGNVDHALSHYRLGVSFNFLGLKKEATECLRTSLALGLGPGDLAAQSMVTFIERELCRWQHATVDRVALDRLAVCLPEGAVAWSSVFAQLALSDDPLMQLRLAKACARFHSLGINPMTPVAQHPLGARLKVGFVSSDFHQHATAVLMAEVFEKLAHDRFEVTLYSHGPQDGSAMGERIKQAAEHFREVHTASDFEVAQQIRADGIEVLVDLKGHTYNARLGIFAYRCAPVQVSYLGFPGTTGADYMDYFIGDAVVSPLENAPHYSEKLALLPGCYQANDRQRPRPQALTRVQAGLPDTGLVLCGFNQPFKLSPEIFDVWCRLLHQIPDSVLWLLRWNDQAPEQLVSEIVARGIDQSRVVFAPRVALPEHISRLALADLFIDTWPCNGHTTASDALWAGVPVVSYSGATFASRVAASLLTAVGLPELIAHSVSDYEAKIIALANDAPQRQRLRDHLVQARDQSPLFDSTAFTQEFGALLWRMAERWSQSLAPDHLTPMEGVGP